MCSRGHDIKTIIVRRIFNCFAKNFSKQLTDSVLTQYNTKKRLLWSNNLRTPGDVLMARSMSTHTNIFPLRLYNPFDKEILARKTQFCSRCFSELLVFTCVCKECFQMLIDMSVIHQQFITPIYHYGCFCHCWFHSLQ